AAEVVPRRIRWRRPAAPLAHERRPRRQRVAQQPERPRQLVGARTVEVLIEEEKRRHGCAEGGEQLEQRAGRHERLHSLVHPATLPMAQAGGHSPPARSWHTSSLPGVLGHELASVTSWPASWETAKRTATVLRPDGWFPAPRPPH